MISRTQYILYYYHLYRSLFKTSNLKASPRRLSRLHRLFAILYHIITVGESVNLFCFCSAMGCHHNSRKGKGYQLNLLIQKRNMLSRILDTRPTNRMSRIVLPYDLLFAESNARQRHHLRRPLSTHLPKQLKTMWDLIFADDITQKYS